MTETDYSALLKRAKSNLPDTILTPERFKIPEPDVFIEGKTTVLKNFMDIVDVIRRDANNLLGFFLRELGTAGVLDGRRVVFKSKLTARQIEEKIHSYVETYVLCSECNRPDTRLVKEGRVTYLECDACGARRPLLAKKVTKPEAAAAIEAGKIYEVTIVDVGKKGDGVARKDEFIIYVAGTTKGQTVRIKVMKVTGTICFGTVVRE